MSNTKVSVGIHSSSGPTSILGGLPTSWENRGLEKLAVWEAGCPSISA